MSKKHYNVIKQDQVYCDPVSAMTCNDKAYILTVTCPHYGDVTTIGIYTCEKALSQAKEIAARCSRIDDYTNRFSVDTFKLNEMPYDCDAGEK